MKSNDFSKENRAPKIPLVVICSPTATGKTALALHLAQSYGGEIINADSLQVYRFMDIGTAKPTREERGRVTHHLIDVVDPDEEYNAAMYARQARTIIDDLNQEGKTIFVVGGTGLYIRALLSGIIETPPVDETLRNYFRSLRDRHGREHIYGLLQQRDPQAARRINPNDSVRVIRALEVLEQSGESIVTLQKKHAFSDSPYDTLKIGLSVDRNILKERIAIRTAKMVDAGLLDEVQSLLAKGYSEKLKPLQSLGYKQMIDYIRGRCNREQAIHLMNRDTWHYSKRQMTWFSADKTISWFEPDQMAAIEDHMKNLLSKRQIF